VHYPTTWKTNRISDGKSVWVTDLDYRRHHNTTHDIIPTSRFPFTVYRKITDIRGLITKRNCNIRYVKSPHVHPYTHPVGCPSTVHWIEQGLMSPPTQCSLSGRQFYRSKDPTNSIKVLKEKLASHRPEAPKPTRGLTPCYKWTSEKRKTLSQWVEPRETKPHTAGWPVQVLYRTIDCATTDATRHFSKTGLGILYRLCTEPTSMMECGCTCCMTCMSYRWVHCDLLGEVGLKERFNHNHPSLCSSFQTWTPFQSWDEARKISWRHRFWWFKSCHVDKQTHKRTLLKTIRPSGGNEAVSSAGCSNWAL